jgi:diguanylate cyclase (GGDEF)-like protein/PAS domain S-box-containing protein
VVAVGLALLLQLLLIPLFGGDPDRDPFTMFFAAVIVAAWLGGLGPGLLATTLSLALSDYSLLYPQYTFKIESFGQFLRLLVFLLEGVFISALIEMMRSARRRAEEASDTYRQSEERYRSVVEQAAESIFLVDAETGHILEANAAFFASLGFEAQEPRQLTLYDIVAQDRESIDRNIEVVLEEGRHLIGEWQYRRKDGALVDVDVSISAIPYGGKEALCIVAHDVTERKALEEELRHQAFHDSLTGLPNRALFLDRLKHALARARREGGLVAVLLLDLNKFKVINDSLGHDAGNAVLIEAAERLQGSVRLGDTVGRLFGDEFGILLEAPCSVEEAKQVAERVGQRLQVPFVIGGRELFVSSSVGIASSESTEDQPKEILRHADLAMYAAKRRGNTLYEMHNPSMDTRTVRRLDLESDLHRAVERKEFEVHYQPIVDLQTGEIAGVEALARWMHPERGLVAAGEFVQVAEENGLIRPIGRWVLEEACRRAKDWSERYPQMSPLMSVNLSASQFAHQSGSITEILDNTGLDANALQLEITERTVMDDAEFSIEKLRQLTDLGVSFTIDDFGMGYSCLYYLKRMPVSSLKIDRLLVTGLVEDPGDLTIVSGTIGLGHALGLKIVAEGVETADQRAKLKELGCDLAQGHYFAKPIPGEAAASLLEQGVSW